MPASLIALLSALGLVATGGVAVATVSVVATASQEQTIKSQDDELTKLEKAMEELRKLKDGQNGQDGKAGLDGDPGPVGPQGKIGVPGEIGEIGPTGQKGVDGTDGLDGANGSDGSNGANGANGSNGANGATGANGHDAERYIEAYYSSLPSVSGIAANSTEVLAHASATRVGTGHLMDEDDTALRFVAIYSGTYLVQYSIVTPQNGPTALTQIFAAQNGAPVPGSISSMYTSTGSQASASFYVHLNADDVLQIAGSTSTFASILIYLPSVSFQVVEFDDGVEYCDPLLGCLHPHP